MSTDTIFALSSGATPSGVAVVRISGSQAFEIAGQLVAHLPRQRATVLKSIRRRNGDLIDQGLVLTFPAPHSFTGEDCLEFQLHGGTAIVAALSAELRALGARPAEAGEFSHRAFDNGKLDLVEVEGLGDLIAAETEMQRRLAVEQSSGGLSARYHRWADDLTRARALIEAELDFADEDDVPGSVSDQVWATVRRLKEEIEGQIIATEQAGSVRDAFKVAIMGPPNAGKSSFLNYWAKRDVAIVTDIAGTTRDVLELDIDLEGFRIRFFDTAGLRETKDRVEQEGIRRALAAGNGADLVLNLSEIDSAPQRFPQDFTNVNMLTVGTKADLHPDLSASAHDLRLSVETGEGMEEIRSSILAEVQKAWSSISALGAGRLRHVAHLTTASHFLAEALLGDQLDLRAECLRLAGDALGRITGRVDVEDMLDVIFSEFCIGK